MVAGFSRKNESSQSSLGIDLWDTEHPPCCTLLLNASQSACTAKGGIVNNSKKYWYLILVLNIMGKKLSINDIGTGDKLLFKTIYIFTMSHIWSCFIEQNV